MRNMFCLMVTKVPKLFYVAMVTTLFTRATSSYYDLDYDQQLWDWDYEINRRYLQTGTNDSCSGIHVEIVVSPQIINTRHNYLVLYWETLSIVPGDKVALYNQDPSNGIYSNNRYLFSAPVNSYHGWVTTNVNEFRSISESYNKICLGYWVAYIRGDTGRIAASSCLSTEPRWMEETWSAISHLSLTNIFIPGTHNSAAYKDYVAKRDDNIAYKYLYCQEISVLKQLLWGVRALDLRIGYYPDTEARWWCNHNVIKIIPLRNVIEQIKLFLRNTQEIIILDVHRFPIGFSRYPAKMHKQLLSYFENELGDYLAPSSLGWTATLGDIKRNGKRVILAYNSYFGLSKYKWRAVKQEWPNTPNLAGLERYLGNLFDRRLNGPWAVMAELTAQPLDVIFDRLGGLRQMASYVNPTITSYFNGAWGCSCHIVHCDYIRGTGIVKAAIKWNLKRAGCQRCNNLINI